LLAIEQANEKYIECLEVFDIFHAFLLKYYKITHKFKDGVKRKHEVLRGITQLTT
jgi:hypothetical protein